jgi:nucleoside-triphosphatase THEP1
VLILVSGPVRAGKTTLCLRLVERAREKGLCVAGVLTPALTEDGSKVGIQAVELGSGERRLLARVDRDLGGTCVGLYCFDDQVLDWVTVGCERALDSESAVVFVDEIGKLELNRGGGLARLIPMLACPREQIVVAIVRDFLLDLLLERLPEVDARVVMVDATYRERAWDELVDLVFKGACCRAGRC